MMMIDDDDPVPDLVSRHL